jgi:hypothetical protein
MKHTNLIRILILLAALALVLLLMWWFPRQTAGVDSVRIDTVYVDKPMPVLRIDTVEIDKPYKVTIYIPDTAARKQAESQDIITSVEIDNGLLSLSKLTPTGLGIKQEYHLPELSAIQIDGKGNTVIVEDKKLKKKQRWQKIKRTAVIVGVGLMGLVIGRI